MLSLPLAGKKQSRRLPKPGTRSEATDYSSLESGDTLIEILVAITILSLTAVALLGAFASDLSGASTYKNTSTIETVLKNFAEDATYQIQYERDPSALFAPCATLSGSATSSGSTIVYNASSTPLNYKPPSGFTLQILSIQYLDQNGTSFGPVTGCDPGQLEPQLIKVQVTGPYGSNGTLSFVVASFNYEAYVQPS